MEKNQKRTKIVATLGPASRDPEIVRALVVAGANVFRLNFSHGSIEEHGQNIATIRKVAQDLGRHIAILQDLPGPKVRTGKFSNGATSISLERGQPFTLTTHDEPGTARRVSVSVRLEVSYRHSALASEARAECGRAQRLRPAQAA